MKNNPIQNNISSDRLIIGPVKSIDISRTPFPRTSASKWDYNPRRKVFHSRLKNEDKKVSSVVSLRLSMIRAEIRAKKEIQKKAKEKKEIQDRLTSVLLSTEGAMYSKNKKAVLGPQIQREKGRFLPRPILAAA